MSIYFACYWHSNIRITFSIWMTKLIWVFKRSSFKGFPSDRLVKHITLRQRSITNLLNWLELQKQTQVISIFPRYNYKNYLRFPAILVSFSLKNWSFLLEVIIDRFINWCWLQCVQLVGGCWCRLILWLFLHHWMWKNG